MRAVACGRCGVSGQCDERGRLPLGWEHYRAWDTTGPVWCAACVDRLLGELLEAFRA